ncbi:MAG TPA: amylo-alpha-1,6-glucosidase, partial [Ruminiclostridium sp.]|nr:amylo-alpha-1,6-glucosidase [Ruminiclostridium sp.]
IDGLQVFNYQTARMEELMQRAGCSNPLVKKLVLAADNFIVYRSSTNAKTIIAGYPWFTDWGRDTMIAFTGLTLATGRFGDAKEILFTFSKYVEYGLIPNMFPDDGEKPAYNSVDAALWYFEAVNSYLEYTGDSDFIKEEVYPCLKNICERFINGTIYDIGMTDDGLITAGNKNTQLTWMDAKVGDWVVTPRHGKAVEINALWYNGLMIMSKLAQKFEDTDVYLEPASRAKASFEKVFWNEEQQCLYDVVNEAGSDSSIRPNQILAVGLSYAVIEGHKARCVVEKVWKELYTPYGLRTLSQDSPQYRGEYSGDVWSRDGAYHQGTVWTWLLGRFIKAYVRVNGNTAEVRRKAQDFILPIENHMWDAGIGSISEIFDGSNPHRPRGCFAQAWSVAEILRAAVEDVGLK